MSRPKRRLSPLEILEGAYDILDKGVYNDLTVDYLARVLRMSKSTLYKYFDGKDDLIAALVDSICTQTEDMLASCQSILKEGTVESMDVLVRVYAGHAHRLPRALILQRHRLPVACQERVELTYAVIRRHCRDILRHSSSEAYGFAGIESPELISVSFFAALRAAMVASARGEVELTRAEAVNAAYKVFGRVLGLVKSSSASDAGTSWNTTV